MAGKTQFRIQRAALCFMPGRTSSFTVEFPPFYDLSAVIVLHGNLSVIYGAIDKVTPRALFGNSCDPVGPD